jgi:hypothetical protein
VIVSTPGEENSMHQLDIYIVENCFGCDCAKDLASNIQIIFPQLEVRILDLARPNTKKPESLFAVPTYILDNSILWVGNPDWVELFERLKKRLS